MNDNKKTTKKQQYKSRKEHLCTEYVVLDENQKIIGDFATAKEAHELKQQTNNATIYVITTSKLQ